MTNITPNQENNKPTTADRILRTNEACDRLGISRGTLLARHNPKDRRYDPNFPKPVKISSQMNGYLESEINAYIQHLANARFTN